MSRKAEARMPSESLYLWHAINLFNYNFFYGEKLVL